MPNVGIQSEVSEAGGEEGACASEAPRGGGVLARARERAGKNRRVARKKRPTPGEASRRFLVKSPRTRMLITRGETRVVE